MGLRVRLTSLDARVGLGPRAGQSWLSYLARPGSRRPFQAALGEVEERLVALERRVAELEGRTGS